MAAGPLGGSVTQRRFRAMGSDAHIVVVGGPPGLVDFATARVDDLERRWSRFIATSEVNLLNRHAGRPVTVSGETRMLVSRSREAWSFSAGAFDPTVLGAVVRAGYDRSFEQLGPAPAPGFSLLGTGIADVTVEADEVCLPAGTGFDPGGIGKGLAADLLAEELMAQGALGVCVNLGGDVRLCGASPDSPGWVVGVEHPWVEAPLARVHLTDGAVATSTTLRRRWESDGQPRHHLIDPQTGEPSTTNVTLATTIAGFAWVAEALAKAVILAGFAHPFDTLGGTGVQGLAVSDTGGVRSTGGLAAYLTEPVPALAFTAGQPAFDVVSGR
jgi:thiamine biosynthesis lipoprotein